MEENNKKQNKEMLSLMRLKVILVIVMVIAVACIVIGWANWPVELFKPTLITEKLGEFEAFPKDPNLLSAGVVVYGLAVARDSYEGGSYIWIENTNDFPVKICVDLPSHVHPMKRFLFTLQPGKVKKLSRVFEDTFFHIYDDREDSKGQPIGFIVPEKPEE